MTEVAEAKPDNVEGEVKEDPPAEEQGTTENKEMNEANETKEASETKDDTGNSVANNSANNGTDSQPKNDRKPDERKSSRDDKSKDDRSKDNRKRKSTSKRSRSRDKRRRDPSPEIRAPSTRRVYIANIPYDAKWQDIKDLFRDKVGDCEFIHLFEDESGKPRGCGLVEFKDPSSVKKALEMMHKFDYKGRKFVVKEDYDSERDRFGRIVKPSSRRRSITPPRRQERETRRERNRSPVRQRESSGVSRWVNTYGLSPQFLESLGITGPITNSVFVANLDYKVSSKKLREVFRIAGRVVSVNLNTDKDGNSRGHGVVTFEHPVEAVQAVSMFNGQVLNDRTLSVKIDRFAEEAETPSSKLPPGLKGIGMGLGANGQPLTNITTALSSVEREPSGYVGSGEGLGNEGFLDRGNGHPADRLSSSYGDRMGAHHERDFGGKSAMSGLMGGFVDRGGSGMGGGFSDRGFSERVGSMGGGASYSSRGSAMDSSYFSDRGASMVLDSSYQTDRSSLSSTNFGGDRGGPYASPSISRFADRPSGVPIHASGASYSDRNLASSMGGGLSASVGAMDSGRYEDFRRSGSSSGGAADFIRREYSPATQENDSFGRQNLGGPVATASQSAPVYVRNLPNGFSRLDLIERFCEAGNIEFAKTSNDGMGVVYFSSQREAQRAIQLFNGIRVDGRMIAVSM